MRSTYNITEKKRFSFKFNLVKHTFSNTLCHEWKYSVNFNFLHSVILFNVTFGYSERTFNSTCNFVEPI